MASATREKQAPSLKDSENHFRTFLNLKTAGCKPLPAGPDRRSYTFEVEDERIMFFRKRKTTTTLSSLFLFFQRYERPGNTRSLVQRLVVSRVALRRKIVVRASFCPARPLARRGNTSVHERCPRNRALSVGAPAPREETDGHFYGPLSKATGRLLEGRNHWTLAVQLAS